MGGLKGFKRYRPGKLANNGKWGLGRFSIRRQNANIYAIAARQP